MINNMSQKRIKFIKKKKKKTQKLKNGNKQSKVLADINNRINELKK